MTQVLADTSVWVDHLRKGDEVLRTLLGDGRVISHPFIVGELACGNLGNRPEVLSLLGSLITADLPDHEEVLYFIDQERLGGKDLGYIDVALLAFCALHGMALYTHDRRLASAARNMGLTFA